MSVITSKYATPPIGGEEEIVSCFVIDDAREAFTLFNVANPGEEYTLSFWVQSDVESHVLFNGVQYQSSVEWIRHINTFTATSNDLVLTFGNTGTYHIYHIQLELGNVNSEWAAAPEDMEDALSDVRNKANYAQTTADDAVKKVGITETAIKVLQDTIQMLVVDENGASMMDVAGGKVTFNMGTYTKGLKDLSTNLNTLKNDLGSTENTVKALNSAVDELGIMTEYVVITTYDDEPCIELGKIDSGFKVRITNTKIQFIDGNAIPAYLSNQKLMIEQAEVKNELQFGGFAWTKRANGNMGIVWKGVDS